MQKSICFSFSLIYFFFLSFFLNKHINSNYGFLLIVTFLIEHLNNRYGCWLLSQIMKKTMWYNGTRKKIKNKRKDLLLTEINELPKLIFFVRSRFLRFLWVIYLFEIKSNKGFKTKQFNESFKTRNLMMLFFFMNNE